MFFFFSFLLLSNRLQGEFVRMILLFITPFEWVRVITSVIVACSQNKQNQQSVMEENGKSFIAAAKTEKFY